MIKKRSINIPNVNSIYESFLLRSFVINVQLNVFLVNAVCKIRLVTI